jgi:hypothetical protein
MRKCDRCGGAIEKVSTNVTVDITWKVCERCGKSFYDWIEMKSE